MAIYHYHRSIGKRASGKNAVFAAAYIRGEKRTCDRTGETNDFSDKIDVVYTKTFIPNDAPLWAVELRSRTISDEHGKKQKDDTGVLFSTYAWNQIEFIEKRIDSQLYFHDDIALPNVLTQEQAIELVDEFVQSSLAINGIFCDVAIHWDDNNHHVHVLMPLRTLNEEGFSKKLRFTKAGLTQEVNRIREDWAIAANQKMKTLGIEERIDHRSYKDRNIALQPTVKVGKFSRLFDNDIAERKLKENQEIRKINALAIQDNPNILATKILQENTSFNNETIQDEILKNSVNVVNQLQHPDSENEIDPVLQKLLASIQGEDAIFNDRDLKNKIKTSIESIDERERIYNEIVKNQHIYSLGLGEDGRQHFIGKSAFDLENELLRATHALSQKTTFNVPQKHIDSVSSQFGLNAAQKRALSHITRGSDAAIVCGYAGTGKTYMLKAAKEVWEKSGFHVIGLSMSGKAVSGLEADTGIESKTIYSFLNAIKNNQILTNPADIQKQQDLIDNKVLKHQKLIVNDKTILVMDEMGMTSLDDMHAVMDVALKAGAKFAGVGDIEQTQPVGRGAPQRAMVEAVGAVFLDTIIRQKDAWMREATALFETNQTAVGFALYEAHGHVHLHETDTIAMQTAVSKWHQSHHLQPGIAMQDCMITAFKNETVDELNRLARNTLVAEGVLAVGEMVAINEGKLFVATGERLLFTKNDCVAQVKNGDFATVLALNEKSMTVKLDSGKTVEIDVEKFKHFKYGYAATVHKLQGFTGKHVNAFIDGEGWDRHKFLVAATRHKLSFNLHAAKDTFANTAVLKEAVSRHGLNDILYDFPVAFGARRGFDTQESAIKATGFIQKTKAKLADAVGFLFNYQEAIEQGQSAYTLEQAQIEKRRKDAVLVAEFCDNRIELATRLNALNELPDAEKQIVQQDIYALQLRNGLIASTIKSNPHQYKIAMERNRIGADKIETAAAFHERHQFVQSLIEAHSPSARHDSAAAFRLINEIKTHYGHVCHFMDDKTARNDFLQNLEHRADHYRKDLAFASFGLENRALINAMMRYKTLDYDVSKRLKAALNKTPHDKRSLYEASTARDGLAFELLSSPLYQDMATHFSFKHERIEKHAQKHQDRLFVKSFAEKSDSTRAQGHLAKQAAAHRIKLEPKRYGIYIDEFLPNGWKSVNLENWLFERRQTIAASSTEFKKSMQAVQRYKTAANLAYTQWQKAIERNKRQSIHKNKGFKQAQGLTWARSCLAHDLMKNVAQHAAALSPEKVDTNKLYQQALHVDYLNRYRSETRDTLKLHMAKYMHGNLKNFQAGLAVYGLYEDVKERAAHWAFLKRVKDAPTSDTKSLIRAAIDYQTKKMDAGKVWGQVKTLQQLNIDARGLQIQSKQLLLQRNEAAFVLLQNCTQLETLTKDVTGVHLNLASLQREAAQHTAHQTVLRYLSAPAHEKGELARDLLANKAGYHLLFDHHITFEALKNEVKQAELKRCLSHSMPEMPNQPKLWDVEKITSALMHNPVATYVAILGEPKERNATHLRYSGGLIVSTKGTDAGKWYSFTEETGGTPLSAIQKYLNLSFPEALAHGASLAGISEFDAKRPVDSIAVKPQPPAQIDTASEQKRINGIMAAQSIWNGTLDSKDTLAAQYFTTIRGVDSIDGMDIRYWPKGAVWVDFDAKGVRFEKPNKIPAAVIAARNAQGEVVSVQRIYLDEKTATKNTFLKDAKLTKGSNKGAPGLIQTGTPGGTLYIAEGPETAASIASIDRKSTVLTSFSVSNIANMADVIKTYTPEKVIIAADNDGESSAARKTTEKACQSLRHQGIDARIVYPPMLAHKTKTDWNDILVEQGSRGLANTFKKGVEQSLSLYEKGAPITEKLADAFFEHHKETLDLSDIRVVYNIDYKGQPVSAFVLPCRNAQGLLCGEKVLALDPNGGRILGERIHSQEPEGFYIAQRGQDKTLYITNSLKDAKLTAARKPKSTVVWSRLDDYAALHKQVTAMGIKPLTVHVVTNDFSNDMKMRIAEKANPFHLDKSTLSLVNSPDTQDAKIIKLDPDALEKARLKMSFEKLLSQKPSTHTPLNEQEQLENFRLLKKEHPILSEYESLSKERMKSAGGYDKEVLDKKLLALASDIVRDKALSARLKRDVPKVTDAIHQRIEMSKKRKIKR